MELPWRSWTARGRDGELVDQNQQNIFDVFCEKLQQQWEQLQQQQPETQMGQPDEHLGSDINQIKRQGEEVDESEDDDWDKDARTIEDLNSPRRPGHTKGGDQCTAALDWTNTDTSQL